MLFLMGILSVDLIITAFKIAQKADHHMDYPCKDLDLSRTYMVSGQKFTRCTAFLVFHLFHEILRRLLIGIVEMF